MASPSSFIQGIQSATIGSATPTALLRVRYNDNTTLNGEGYDDDRTETQTWANAANGAGTVEGRDPDEIASLIGANGSFTVVGANQKAGGTHATHIFYNCRFAGATGDVQGGRNAPGMFSINFRYGGMTINGVGVT